jgi:hypothetical protein
MGCENSRMNIDMVVVNIAGAPNYKRSETKGHILRLINHLVVSSSNSLLNFTSRPIDREACSQHLWRVWNRSTPYIRVPLPEPLYAFMNMVNANWYWFCLLYWKGKMEFLKL